LALGLRGVIALDVLQHPVHFGPGVAFYLSNCLRSGVLVYFFPLLNLLTALTDMGKRAIP
jgi:positive regulator of sigma E activity